MVRKHWIKICIVANLLLMGVVVAFAQGGTEAKSSMITISNSRLAVSISTVGAELKNITSQHTGHEYLWQADPEYWGYSAPVLFPFIGRLWNGTYLLNGNKYPMGIHGFARDHKFRLARINETEAWFTLASNGQIMKVYPFPFELTIGYILNKNRLKVVWDVKNTGQTEMYFQIGGHPAFNYPDFNQKDSLHAYLSFDLTGDNLSYVVKDSTNFLNPNPENHFVSFDKDSLMPVSQGLFADDALIFQNYQARKVTLYDLHKKKYLSVEFDMPVFTLWSTRNKKAPFICIEPLWGRIDEFNMTKDMRNRVWTQHVSPGERFITSYEIEIF